jgi:hypothetical protein
MSKECLSTCPYASQFPGLLGMIRGNAPDGRSDLQGAIEAEYAESELLAKIKTVAKHCPDPEVLPVQPSIVNNDPPREYRCMLADAFVIETFGLNEQ